MICNKCGEEIGIKQIHDMGHCIHKENFCWVCRELIKVNWVRIEFTHIIKELGVGDFNYCPKCGRKI